MKQFPQIAARLAIGWFLTLLISPLIAVDRTWIGPIDGQWSNADNWDSEVPLSGDRAIFPVSSARRIVVNETVSVGSIHLIGAAPQATGKNFQGDGKLILDGTNSEILVDKGLHSFAVPIDLTGDSSFSINDAYVSIRDEINLNAHTLSTTGTLNFSEAMVSGPGMVQVNSGVLSGSGIIAADTTTTDGLLRPESSFTILGNANIAAELDIFDTDRFDTIIGDGGTLNVGSLRIQMRERERVEMEFNLFPGWGTITYAELDLPQFGAADWDTTRLDEGILRLTYENAERCDLDLSGNCDIGDLDSLGIAVHSGTDDKRYDLNDDDVVNLEDRDEWLYEVGLLTGFTSAFNLGDANLDGHVNSADLMSLAISWQSATGYWSGGDFTMDGFVDVSDLNALGRNWQKALTRTANPVPEPARYLPLIVFVFVAQFVRHQAKCMRCHRLDQ